MDRIDHDRPGMAFPAHEWKTGAGFALTQYARLAVYLLIRLIPR